MGLFDDLLEEDELTQQPVQPQSRSRKGGLFDDLLEEEDLIQDTKPQIAQPSIREEEEFSYFKPIIEPQTKEQKKIGTLEGIANASRNAFDSSRQALDIVGDVTPEEAQNIAKIEFDKQSRKIAPGYDEYQKAEGFDAVLAFAKNPIEVTSNIVAEGLAGSLPALGVGLAAGGVGAAIGAPTVIGAPIGFTAGQVAGTFAGSLATEYGSKILEEMQEGGVDLTKPESIQRFFENEEAVAAARDKAISRGIPVAAFDAISAGIGGKLGRVIGKQFLTKTGEAAAELGVQAGLGGGGEVAGALVAGEPIEGKAVFGEIIGEAGPGAAEIITGRMADRAARVKAEEEKKIKAAAQLSDNLEQNSAPLTAAAVKSTTATTIEQDKLAAQLEEQLDADEIASQVSGQIAPTITPAVTPAVPTAQPPITDATQEIIQPEGVRQEPQDGTQVQPTEETGVGDSLLGAARGQEEGQVVPAAPAIPEAITRAIEERRPISAPFALQYGVDLPSGWTYEDDFFVPPAEPAAEVAAPEPTISEIPATSELVGEQPVQPTIREVPEISPIVGAEPAAIVEQEPSKVYDETQTRIRGIQAPPAGGEIVLEPEPLANQGGITKQEKQVGRGAGDREKQRGYAGVAGQALPRTIPELTEDQAETLRDFISLRKSQGREPNPEHVKRLAEYDARNAGVEVQQGDIVSNIVVGHPLFEAPQPELQNLVPIKVQNKEQLASSIQRTENVRNAAQTYIGQYQAEQAKAKTAAQKKAFAKKFSKSEFDRQRDILDYINNDVMPELDRMEKAAPTPAPTPVTTPPVTEAVTPSAEQPAVSIPASGKPFEFFSIRNKEKAPRLGTQFGQDVEPSGKYISQSTPDAAKNLDARFEKKTVRFENPLVVEFGGEYGTPTNWKNVLSSQYGGKTGKELSQAIRDAGYDGIVTVEPAKGPNRPASTSEIVDISSLKPKKQVAAPTPAAPAEPAAEPAGISVGNRVKSGRDPKVYVVEEVLPQTEAEQREGDYSVMLRDEKSGKIDRYPFSVRGLKKIGEKKIKKTEVAQITEPAGVATRKPATFPVIPSIEEQTAEMVYGGQTGLYDPFSGVQRKRVKAEDSAGRKGDEAQIKNADQHAAEIGGTVLYQDGDISLIRGYSIWGGNPVYIVANKDSRSKTDISSYTGKLVTPEQRSQLIDIKNKIEAQDQASFDNKPFITFTDGVAFSNGVPSTIAGVLSGWKSLLNIKSNLYVTTYNDAVTDKDKFNGPHRVIGSAGLASSKTDGSIRRMPNGDFYIMFREIPSKTKMLETLAHELGHLHEKEAFENASAATKQMLREEHSKWVKSQTGKTAKELVSSLRPVKAAKANLGAAEGMMADELSPYWKSFGEWYADQVSRWAVSSDKPLTIVDRFFSRIAKALKSFYLNITNQGYLPNETFVQYLEKTLNEPSRIVSEQITTDQEFEQLSQQLGDQEAEVEPTEEAPADEARREQVAGMKIGRIITTPPGITQKTTDIIRSKFFDSTKVSPENTSQAWAYISQFMDETDNNNNKFAGYVNQVTEEELAPEFRKGIKESMGASLFSVELANYAGRLAVQGDTKMLAYMIRNGNKMPTGEFASGVSQSGRVLNAFKKRLSSDISGVAAYETELESNVERLAAVLFGTNTPSKEQIKIAQDALTQSESAELDLATEVADDIKRIESRTNKDILKKIDDFISGYDNPKKDQLLLIFANLIRSRDVDGITISYKPAKVSISDRIANLLVKNLANYRDTLVDKAASGLESTFWRTMSSQENKPGLLGELDQAQNNELAKIVKATLIKMKLAGEPQNTKMTDIEKVASILNESKLSEEKRIEADKRIVAEIDRRRQEELSTTNNPDAVNAKYDSILKAWNDSMSRQLNMPVSDSMLQRLISSEMKEQDIKIRDLVDEADGKVVVEKKQNIINSIIRKIYGVSKESETGIEMDENYDGLKSYLEQTLDNMYALSVEEKNAAYAKRQAQISLRNTAESQAQSIINRLADQLSDTPAFPEKQENEVKAIVQQDLKQIPDMNRKQPWTSQLTAKLMRAGVSETQAQIISDLVWRQHEIKAMDRESRELQTAAEKGSLAVIIDRIKNTPLEKQQSPEWKQEVIKEYLRDAGLSSKAAETAAKLYDSVISERLAAAKQKAFEDTLAKAAPWNNYASRNGKLAKDALKKIRDAIRTGVLDPEKNAESIIAAQSGWTGFTKEQYQRIVELDTILNDPNQDDITKREAMFELNKIITKAKMPVRFKDALGAYYIGNALMGIPTALVNIVSPISFSIRNLMVDIAKYTKDNPAKIPVAFETFLDSMRSWYNQTSYAFKNQIYLNDVVEYLNGQNVLRETFDKGKKQWAEGKYAEGFANMAVGMTQITGRVLSALDQGAISMLENQNITRYAMAALENAKKKVPKNKIVEFANMTLDLKRRVIIENIAAGMDADRAGVLADLAVKSELRAALSEYEADTQSVLDSAINDALQSVGRNKVITIEGIERQQKDVSDSGILSYWPIKMLETVSRGAGNEGSGMQIFSKMVYGFALVPARTFHTAAWFSPYGFLRLAIDKYKTNKGQESPYAMSLQTEAQYRQRLTESIAGSIAMLGLFALRSGSSDEDEDKKFKIVITGNGPNAVTDKQYYDSWIKKYKPYSINIVLGDTVIPINIGRGGEALFFPIMLAGALDDYEIKSKQNLTKKEPDDLNAATEMLGSAFFALAQRGPYAAFTEPLFDASKQGRVTENLVSQLGYFGKTFVPVLGASITRNISDIINDPVDRSSIEGAIYANTPIVGPWVGTKALNALGQPIRADDWGDKLYKLGVPVVFSFPKNTPENELNELILKQGGGPTLPTRANAQKRFGDVLTSKEFETYVREYGRVMSDKMFKNRTRLANMKSADYDDELEKYARGYSIDGIKIKGASDSAVLAVKRMRQ